MRVPNVIISVSLLPFLLLSCKKEEQEQPPQKKSYIKVLHYDTSLNVYRFKISTTWIYKDSLSNRVDTVKVTGCSDEELEAYGPCGVHGYVPDTCEHLSRCIISTTSSLGSDGISNGGVLQRSEFGVPCGAYGQIYPLFQTPVLADSNYYFSTCFLDSTITIGSAVYPHCFGIKYQRPVSGYSYFPFPNSDYMQVYRIYCPDTGLIRQKKQNHTGVPIEDWWLISSVIFH
jgi:hypothetical protein